MLKSTQNLSNHHTRNKPRTNLNQNKQGTKICGLPKTSKKTSTKKSVPITTVQRHKNTFTTSPSQSQTLTILSNTDISNNVNTNQHTTSSSTLISTPKRKFSNFAPTHKFSNFSPKKRQFSTLQFSNLSNTTSADLNDISETDLKNLLEYADYDEKEYASDIGSDYEDKLFNEQHYDNWLQSKFAPIFLATFHQLLLSNGLAKFPIELSKSQKMRKNAGNECYPSSHLNRELLLQILLNYNIIIPNVPNTTTDNDNIDNNNTSTINSSSPSTPTPTKPTTMSVSEYNKRINAIPDDIKRIKQPKINEIWQKLQQFLILDDISMRHYRPGFCDPYLSHQPYVSYSTPLPDIDYIAKFQQKNPGYPSKIIPLPADDTIVDYIYTAMVLAGGKDYINGHFRIQRDEIYQYQLPTSDFSHLLPRNVNSHPLLGSVEFNLTLHKANIAAIAPKMVSETSDYNKRHIESIILRLEAENVHIWSQFDTTPSKTLPNMNRLQSTIVGNDDGVVGMYNDIKTINSKEEFEFDLKHFEYLYGLFVDYHRFDIRLGWRKQNHEHEALYDKIMSFPRYKGLLHDDKMSSTYSTNQKSGNPSDTDTGSSLESINDEKIDDLSISKQQNSPDSSLHGPNHHTNNTIGTNSTSRFTLTATEYAQFHLLVKRQLLQYLFDLTYLFQPQIHHAVFNMDYVSPQVQEYYSRQFTTQDYYIKQFATGQNAIKSNKNNDENDQNDEKNEQNLNLASKIAQNSIQTNTSSTTIATKKSSKRMKYDPFGDNDHYSGVDGVVGSVMLPSSKDVVDVDNILVSPSLQKLSHSLLTGVCMDAPVFNDGGYMADVYSKMILTDDIKKRGKFLWSDLKQQLRLHIIVTPPVLVSDTLDVDNVIDQLSGKNSVGDAIDSGKNDNNENKKSIKNDKKQANVMVSGGDQRKLRSYLSELIGVNKVNRFTYPVLKHDEYTTLLSTVDHDNIIFVDKSDSNIHKNDQNDDDSDGKNQIIDKNTKLINHKDAKLINQKDTKLLQNKTFKIVPQPLFLSPTGNPPRDTILSPSIVSNNISINDDNNDNNTKGSSSHSTHQLNNQHKVIINQYDPFQHPLLGQIHYSSLLNECKVITPLFIDNSNNYDDGNNIKNKKTIEIEYHGFSYKNDNNNDNNDQHNNIGFNPPNKQVIFDNVRNIIKSLFNNCDYNNSNNSNNNDKNSSSNNSIILHNNNNKSSLSFTQRTANINNNNDGVMNNNQNNIITTLRSALIRYYNPSISHYAKLHAPNLYEAFINDATFTGYSLPQQEYDILISIIGLSIMQNVLDQSYITQYSTSSSSSSSSSSRDNNNHNNTNTNNNKNVKRQYYHVLCVNDDEMRANIDFLRHEFEPYLPQPLVCAFLP